MLTTNYQIQYCSTTSERAATTAARIVSTRPRQMVYAAIATVVTATDHTHPENDYLLVTLSDCNRRYNLSDPFLQPKEPTRDFLV